MKDHELDALLVRAAVVTDHDIAEWTRDTPFGPLCEEIMSTVMPDSRHPDSPVNTTGDHPSGRRLRRSAHLVMAAAAAALAIVGIGTIVDVRGGTEAVWAAELVDFARRSPLLLIDDPEWRVTYADEYGPDGQGQMTFASQAKEAELSWRSGPLSGWLEDRLDSGTDHGAHDLINGTATMIRYDDSNEYTALWEADGRVLEFRTQAANVNEFAGLLDALVVVDVDAWLEAMPASVIARGDQPTVIREMLTGIPLPDGFDPDSLAGEAGVEDRYQLGAHVVSAVSCAWIDQWVDATEAGDATALQQATDAMDTSSEWPIILEMNQSGAYGQVLQSYVDAMHNGGQLEAAEEPALADSYGDGLGCSQ